MFNNIKNYIGGNGHGVAVLGCGPQSMLDDIKKYAAKYGVDCHTEIFEF